MHAPAHWATVQHSASRWVQSPSVRHGRPRGTPSTAVVDPRPVFELVATEGPDADVDVDVAVAGASDADMMVPWTLKKAGETMFTLPRVACLRSFVMNHLIHHRGQLTVYLRQCDVALPMLYGPTADESM